MELSIRKADFRAALICSASKDIRYYLNGVHIEFVPGKDGGIITFVGTDGHILFAGTAPAEWMDDEQTAPFWMTIPGETVKAACKGKMPHVILRSLPDGKYSLGDIIFAPIDGRFPDFRRVIPAQVSGERGNFDPAILATAQSALREYFNAPRHIYTLHANGNGAGVMCGNSRDAVVVVMPCTPHAGDEYTGVNLPVFPEELRKVP